VSGGGARVGGGSVVVSNDVAIEAWNGVLFDRFGASVTSSPPDSERMAFRGFASTHPDPVTGRSISAAALATPPGSSPGSSGPAARRSGSMPLSVS
jgi:hypothetical protein